MILSPVELSTPQPTREGSNYSSRSSSIFATRQSITNGFFRQILIKSSVASWPLKELVSIQQNACQRPHLFRVCFGAQLTPGIRSQSASHWITPPASQRPFLHRIWIALIVQGLFCFTVNIEGVRRHFNAGHMH